MSVHFPESLLLASILPEQCVRHQERLWIRMLAKDHPETNPITIKPETASHMAEQFSWVPLPYCSPPGFPFPVKSLALSADVSLRTIHFRVLDKRPVSGPGKGPPSCKKIHQFNSYLPCYVPGPLPDAEVWPSFSPSWTTEMLSEWLSGFLTSSLASSMPWVKMLSKVECDYPQPLGWSWHYEHGSRCS